MPKCAQYGTDLPTIDAHALWREGNRICQNCAGKSQLVEPRASQRPPAPSVKRSDVWFPILFLVLVIFLGFLSPGLGVLTLIGATLYVYVDAKKYGIGSSRAIVTLLFSIIGLPLYAYDLHKLRKAQQTGQLLTLVEPTAKPQPSVNGRQVADVVKPTKFCRVCGAKIPRDSMFCQECGEKIV
jgi:hypothetical protein